MSAAAKLPSDKQSSAAESVAKLVAGKLEAARRPPKPFRASKGGLERARAQMNEMAESGDWSAASGTHLVALYEWLHAEVYGVSPAELDGRAWAIAAQSASRMVEIQFGGDRAAAVIFMKWTWKRESDREAWRRENDKPGGRIGWRLQFGGALVTDYKVDLARGRSRDGR